MAFPREILRIFPSLVEADCEQTSPRDRFYNCIGHAAEPGRRRFWWPVVRPFVYWPSSAPCELTIAAFEAAFATLGYGPCSTDLLEDGIEKIALFVDAQARPTHAALQLADGHWTSKLGGLEDISHPLRQLEGTQYGTVAFVMARPRALRSS